MGIIVPTGKSGIFGDKKKHKRARAVLPILVLRAQEPNTITFRELGNAIGFRRYDLFGDILDCINTELYWINEEIPTLSTIVVRVVDSERMPSNWMGKQLNMEATWEITNITVFSPFLNINTGMKLWAKLFNRQTGKWNL